jgi:hypothetical protein
MTFDEKTRLAIEHTRHCLIGCGLGEIAGMLIASFFGWHRIGRLPLAVILAFIFGYTLTYKGVRRHAKSRVEAIKITAATDTISIAAMELIDNTIEFIIPNALVVTASSFRFWWGLALALGSAFLIAVPVNRYMISRNPNNDHHH